MNVKKLLALVLCLCLALGMASCGTPNGEAGNTPDETPSGSGSPIGTPSDTPGDSEASNPPPAYVNEFTQNMAGVDADTVMFTVDGTDVTAEYFFYWLAYTCSTMDAYSQLYLGQSLDFDQTNEQGSTLAEYLKEEGRKQATAFLLLEKEALAKGKGPTEEQIAQAEEEKASYNASQGDFDELLRQLGVSEELFDRLNLLSGCMIDNMLSDIPAPTEEEQEAYITENDRLRAKHILIRTVVENEDGTVTYARGGTPENEDGSAYTGTAEEFNTAAKEKVEGLLAQLAEAEDPVALFDQLMQENSEDPGLTAYPDGYDFTAGEMHEEFEQGVRDLEYGAYSKQAVETSDGYHIILRLRPDVEAACREAKLGEMMQEWAESEFTPTPAYETLDVKEFYANYNAHLDSFMDDPAQESGSPTDSPSPSESPSEPLDSETPSPVPEGETPSPTPEGETPSPTPEGETPSPTPEGETPSPTPEGETPSPTPEG